MSYSIEMSSSSKALDIPEILHTIARKMPLFELESGAFTPCNLFPCILVSKLWYQSFLPHLYHYYVSNHNNGLWPRTSRRIRDNWNQKHQQYLTSLRKNSHHFRRFEIYSIPFELPYDEASPPTNLVGVFIYYMIDNVTELLCLNQGSQLKQLVLYGTRGELNQECREAITNLPCLEELELKDLIVSNELLSGILRKCASTLKTMTLDSVAGFDKGLFILNNNTNQTYTHGDGSDDAKTHALPQLTRLETLSVSMDWTQSRATVFLPRICPALQSLYLTVDIEEHDMLQLTATLRAHCPQLNLIDYREGYSLTHEFGYFPEPAVHASLFKDSTPCLKSASTGLPIGLEPLMLDALLTHASTLEDLELTHRFRQSYVQETIGLSMPNVQKLLVKCRNLRRLVLSNVLCSTQDLEYLCIEPWVCCNLETLEIDGFVAQEKDEALLEKEEIHRKWIRQNSSPHRLRHHEYRWNEDDNIEGNNQCGQSQSRRQGGWYLEAGMSQQDFREALMDGEIKRKFLAHLSITSALNNLRSIRLENTVFFRDEQPFEDFAEEINEIEMEEEITAKSRHSDPN